MAEPASDSGRRTSVMKRATLLVAVCGLILIAGCADDSAAPGGASGTATRPATPDVSSSPAPLPSAGDVVTLRGTVTEGVEAGCLVLTSGGVVYTLTGPSVRELRPGQEVEVDGRVDEGMLSTCQQGKIFTVTAVRPG